MNYDGPPLAVDPVYVWQSSWTDFPDMAASYAAVSRALDTSKATEITPTEFYARWSTSRDRIQDALADSASNTDAVAAAIRQALTAYLVTDDQAARELRAADATGDIDIDKDIPGIDPRWSPLHRPPAAQPAAGPGPGPDGNGQCPAPMAPTDSALLAKATRYYEVWQRAQRAELSEIKEIVLDIGDHGYQDFGSGEVGHQILAAAMPEPAWYQPVLDTLPATDPLSATAGGTSLGLTSQAVERIKSWLSEERWGGETAENYRIEHLAKYEDIVAIQTSAVSALEPLLSDFQLGVAQIRTDLERLLDEAIDACQQIVDEQAVDVENFVTKALITTVTLGAAAMTGGAALVTTGVIVTLQESLALKSKGSTAKDISKNLRDGIAEITDRYRRFDEQMVEQVDTLTANLTAVDGDGLLRIPRPAFADAPGSFLPSGQAVGVGG